MATVLVSNGTLHVGDIVLAGTYYGKVKAMFNERNQRLKEGWSFRTGIDFGFERSAFRQVIHSMYLIQIRKRVKSPTSVNSWHREQGLAYSEDAYSWMKWDVVWLWVTSMN